MNSKLTDRLRTEITIGASEIARLHSVVRSAFRHREENDDTRGKWIQAAEEFRRRYDLLSFPGGYEGALERIIAGDANTIEASICFLELRPFFFRSGYMFKDILRKCRKAPLSNEQRRRFDAIEANVLAWRKRKQERDNNSRSKL